MMSSSSSSSLTPMLQLMENPQKSTLFKQGAEAKVYISHLFPAPTITTLSNNATNPAVHNSLKPTIGLLKYRFPKTYRHQSLSTQLTASRTTAEARALVRCAKAGVNTPRILCVDEVQGVLGLEYIDGNSVRELLGGGSEGDETEEEIEEREDVKLLEEEEALGIMKLIGMQLAMMHQAHVIHGDLTTSNMMVRRSEGKSTELILIDFGLSSNSTMPEDKAVDLYVLERAFQSTHPSSEHLFSAILQSYQETLNATSATTTTKATGTLEKVGGKKKADKSVIPGPTNWIDIQRKLEDVRMRGRKRSMVG